MGAAGPSADRQRGRAVPDATSGSAILPDMPHRAFQRQSTSLWLLGAAFVVAAIVAPSLVARSATTGHTTTQSASSNTLDPTLYQDLRWRNVGPTRGGRVTAIAGVRSQPCTFYMGRTGGGIWKTENCGERVDADQRRADLHRLDRLHRRLRIEPERRLRRHRQRGDPQQRHHRSRRLQVHRRRDARGSSSG